MLKILALVGFMSFNIEAQRHKGTEGFKLPAAEVSELESGDSNWESRHLGGCPQDF